RFVGFANYEELLHSASFWNSFKNSVVYSIGFTSLAVCAGLLLALVLNEPNFKGKGFYRTLYFLPVVTTSAIVGIIMKNIFGVEGFVNAVLESIGVIRQGITWLLTPWIAMIVLIIVGVWKQAGITMI